MMLLKTFVSTVMQQIAESVPTKTIYPIFVTFEVPVLPRGKELEIVGSCNSLGESRLSFTLPLYAKENER